MVGGNGYDESGNLFLLELPPYDLYLRWIQVNAMMPMQMSVAPWRFKKVGQFEIVNEGVNRVLELRTKLRKYFVTAIEEASKYPFSPLIRPLWFVWPTDAKTFSISDQYLLGGCVMVAPILYPNTTNRTLYLPNASRWKVCVASSEQQSKTFYGPLELVITNISLT